MLYSRIFALMLIHSLFSSWNGAASLSRLIFFHLKQTAISGPNQRGKTLTFRTPNLPTWAALLKLFANGRIRWWSNYALYYATIWWYLYIRTAAAGKLDCKEHAQCALLVMARKSVWWLIRSAVSLTLLVFLFGTRGNAFPSRGEIDVKSFYLT